MNRTIEIDLFKTEINLTAYAASCGYILDQKTTSRNSAVMVHHDGDKIVIARAKEDKHWVYFSVRDHNDNAARTLT